MDSDFVWYTAESKRFVQKDYLLPGQSLTDRVEIICQTAERLLGPKAPKDFAARFRANLQRGWYSLSTPIWTNFGTDRGLPCSCYNSHISDRLDSILGETHAEMAMMSKVGGGTSAYMGDVRSRGSHITGNGKSFGTIPFAAHKQSLLNTASQGQTRRGNAALYWPIEHGDIDEVLDIRSPGSPIQELHFGVTVANDWLRDAIAGDAAKRKTWAKLLTARKRTGEPYILFRDTFNRLRPQWYKDKNYYIRSSNLCAETSPTSNEDESFVCVLASMNDLYFEDWKDTDAVELLAYLLEAVVTEFIEKSRRIPYMGRAVRYTERHRSIGIGRLGWHSYLQSRMVPFESMEAKRANYAISRVIWEKADAASRRMAADYGEPEVTKGYGRRHALLVAIAPTKSSSFILGQASEGIEPRHSNYVIEDKAKGKFTFRNPYLRDLLAAKGRDDSPTWKSILMNGGSVQHLDFLTPDEKGVFKTFMELSQLEVVQQAAQRQQFIDQSQSLNVMIHQDTPAHEVNRLILTGWELGVKSFYYAHSTNAAKTFAQKILSCSACES